MRTILRKFLTALSNQFRYLTFLLLLTIVTICITIGNIYASGRIGIGIYMAPILIYFSANALVRKRYLTGILLFIMAIFLSQF